MQPLEREKPGRLLDVDLFITEARRDLAQLEDQRNNTWNFTYCIDDYVHTFCRDQHKPFYTSIVDRDVNDEFSNKKLGCHRWPCLFTSNNNHITNQYSSQQHPSFFALLAPAMGSLLITIFEEFFPTFSSSGSSSTWFPLPAAMVLWMSTDCQWQ